MGNVSGYRKSVSGYIDAIPDQLHMAINVPHLPGKSVGQVASGAMHTPDDADDDDAAVF